MEHIADGFKLMGKHGQPSPVLTGVQASGRLDGVLFELTLRQNYKNTSKRVLEVVYSFPLPHQAVLLGFAAEFNGQRQDGTIVAKRTAESQYEEALAEGDAPVMLEALAGGLHTANIGNLKPGDQIVVESRFAQLLAFEQGRLRLAIPMTIAPRYGSAELGGLQPQQVPQPSMAVEYPLALSVTVAGSLAGAAVDCPTHRFTRTAIEGGVRLELAPGAWMDRDVVMLVTPKERCPSLVVSAADLVSEAAPLVMMAALLPPVTAPRERVAIKLLVDCSGSMGGDSIASARVALHGVLAGLGEADLVSLSRFGSQVEHVLGPTACSPRVLRLLAPKVDAIVADLGGTDMEAALRAVFGLRVEPSIGSADVLLITDGEIWQAQEMIDAAKASGHRLFAIGVGTSPAEGVLRTLAEATGGACEFTTPGEALEAAAQRMLQRVRQRPWQDVRIDWGQPPVWQSSLPAAVFGGDTVIAFAGLARQTQPPGVRLSATDTWGEVTELARGEAQKPCTGNSLPRIAASRRMANADEAESLALALDYQLLGSQTNCILVHRRAEAEKTTEQAELHRVESMLAAGWGATSTVGERRFAAMDNVSFSVSAESIAEPARCFGSFDAGNFGASYAVAAEYGASASLQDVALAVADHLEHGGQLQGLASHCAHLLLSPEVESALDQAQALGASEGQALLLLAHWVSTQSGGLVDKRVADALQAHVGALGTELIEACMALFDRLLRQSFRDEAARDQALDACD